MMITLSGKFYQCYLQSVQINDIVELTCECNKFGDIFLITSSNITSLVENSTNQQIINEDIDSTFQDYLILMICTCSLTFVFLTIYITYLIRDQTEEEKLDSEPSSQNQDKSSLTYLGNSKVFKQQFKLIHQSISIFYYKDKNIQLSFRILEVFSQFNVQLSLTILECFLLNNQILFICIFIFANPFITLILKILYKIIEAIYRFKRIASFISQFLLIILLITPNLILFIFYIFKIQMQSEYYLIIIILGGNILLSQALLEPITIYIRILLYRLIASSIKNMELNPVFHLIHFFVMHSSLEDIFDEFTRI
ncbi:unnamed protein product [Paramecium pentaurelia]|uniref:Transmembrane protein n=1 Tax=Paramecium pentaurelia TaxID=43138 RepID=A0A8S1XVD3_9CILI|nr:unnamed protein product [Paramecium pentaurelia]